MAWAEMNGTAAGTRFGTAAEREEERGMAEKLQETTGKTAGWVGMKLEAECWAESEWT